MCGAVWHVFGVTTGAVFRSCAVLLVLCAVARSEGVSYDAIFVQAAAKTWRARWHAVEQLARVPLDDGIFERLRPALLTDERAEVREAIAWAADLEPRLLSATLLGLALQRDKDPRVRRAAARALRHHRDRRAVNALVKALQKEDDARTRLRIIQTLRELTPAPCLLDAEAWRDWWSNNDSDPRFKPADEPPRKETYDGVVLETKTVEAVPRDKTNVRPLPHVLVLPSFGWNTEMYGPYLLPLRERSALTWVRLPSVQALTGRSGYGADVPVYPVGRLVRALDRFRAAHKIDRFLILASGASGWFAMRYAQKHPSRCAGLLLIDTILDTEAYLEALQRGAAFGDKGEKWTAKTLMKQNSAPHNRATLDRLHVYGIERGFYDRSDLEIAHLYKQAREPQGFASVPPLKFKGRVRIKVPTIFVYSAASAFSGHRDAVRIGKHFPNSLVTPIRNTRGMAYVETNDEFHRVLNHYFDRYFSD